MYSFLNIQGTEVIHTHVYKCLLVLPNLMLLKNEIEEIFNFYGFAENLLKYSKNHT